MSSLLVALDMGFALYRRFFVPANGSPVSLLSFFMLDACVCMHMYMYTYVHVVYVEVR